MSFMLQVGAKDSCKSLGILQALMANWCAASPGGACHWRYASPRSPVSISHLIPAWSCTPAAHNEMPLLRISVSLAHGEGILPWPKPLEAARRCHKCDPAGEWIWGGSALGTDMLTDRCSTEEYILHETIICPLPHVEGTPAWPKSTTMQVCAICALHLEKPI